MNYVSYKFSNLHGDGYKLRTIVPADAELKFTVFSDLGSITFANVRCSKVDLSKVSMPLVTTWQPDLSKVSTPL